MCIKRLQLTLEKERTRASKIARYDMGGCLLHCQYCEYADHRDPILHGKCYASPEIRKAKRLCANAYLRLKEKKCKLN